MRDQIEQRLRELNQEFETGRRMLAELENKQTGLRQTLQRISGAIQVLEELLGAQVPPEAAACLYDVGSAPQAMSAPVGGSFTSESVDR